MSSDDIIISHPAGTRTLALRESYLAICDGDKCEAHLLNANERWYAYKLKSRQQARHVNRTAQANGEDASADEGLWVFMSAQEWVTDLLSQYDEKTVRNKLAKLVERGFLSRRSNPTKKWDRKPQWLFMRSNVQAAVDAWASARVQPDIDPNATDLAESADQDNSGNSTDTTRENARMESGEVPNGTGQSTDSNRANARSNTTGISHRGLSQESITGGEYNLESNARANQPQGAPVVEPSPAPITTSFAARETAGGQTRPAAGVAVLPPDGGAADAAVTDSDLEFLFGDQVTEGQETGTITEVQEAPGGAAGPLTAQDVQEALSGLSDEPHDPEATRAALVPALGGQKRLNTLMEETPPGLKAGARRGWITQITPERAAELIILGRQDAGADNPWTYIIRRLDQEVGAQIKRGVSQGGSASTPAVTLPGAYMTAEEKAAQAASAPVVTAGETWYGRKSGQPFEITEVTSQSVFVDGLGEYTLAKFLANFRSDA